MAPVLPSAQGFYAPGFHRLASLEELLRQTPRVETLERSVSGGTWQVISDSPSSVLLPLQWWPEWRITLDGREIPFANHTGLVAIRSKEGTATASARLRPSRSRRIGTAVSLVGLVMLTGLAWCSGRGSSARGRSWLLPIPRRIHSNRAIRNSGGWCCCQHPRSPPHPGPRGSGRCGTTSSTPCGSRMPLPDLLAALRLDSGPPLHYLLCHLL